MKSGIYQIINTVNNKRYIGSSKNTQRRLNNHKAELIRNAGRHKHLQYAFNIYGLNAFSFEVIEYCEEEKLIEREQFWVDKYDIKTELYNKRDFVERNNGVKHSEESKAKRRGKSPANKKEPIELICHHCNSKFYVIPSKSKKAKCCSKQCDNLNRKGKSFSKDTQFKKGHITFHKFDKEKPSWNTSYFEFVSPENILYTGKSVLAFSKSMNLHSGHMSYVRQGKFKQHKGWRLPLKNESFISQIHFENLNNHGT